MFIQRSPLRLTDGWHRLKGWRGAYVRDLMGHHLVIFHGNTNSPDWHTWIDGHYRGMTKKLKVAEARLEAEAQGKGPLWDKMKKFLGEQPVLEPVLQSILKSSMVEDKDGELGTAGAH